MKQTMLILLPSKLPDELNLLEPGIHTYLNKTAEFVNFLWTPGVQG